MSLLKCAVLMRFQPAPYNNACIVRKPYDLTTLQCFYLFPDADPLFAELQNLLFLYFVNQKSDK